MRKSIGPKEEEAMRESLERGETPECPRCETLLRITPVPPRSDLSYVRNRAVLTCESCGLRIALDRN